MFKYSKISEYKIKKILKYFADDFTAASAAKPLKLNNKTVNFYYAKFRNVTLIILVELLSQNFSNVEYLGYLESFHFPNEFYDLYKYGENLYSVNKLSKKPSHNVHAFQKQEVKDLIIFFCNRVTKYYGFCEKSYRNQASENAVRYYYKDSDIFYDVLLKKIKTLSKHNSY